MNDGTMLISDLLPLTLFTIYAYHHPTIPPPLWGPMISRLFSLIYHQSTHPSFLYLDYLGICSMAFSVPGACAMAEEGWGVNVCGPFNAALAITLGLAILELGIHASGIRTSRSPEHAVLVIGLMGNAPVIAIIFCSAISSCIRLLFAFSLMAFGVGYFLLKPRHHVLWHWAAAAGQAAGVAALS